MQSSRPLGARLRTWPAGRASLLPGRSCCCTRLRSRATSLASAAQALSAVRGVGYRGQRGRRRARARRRQLSSRTFACSPLGVGTLPVPARRPHVCLLTPPLQLPVLGAETRHFFLEVAAMGVTERKRPLGGSRICASGSAWTGGKRAHRACSSPPPPPPCFSPRCDAESRARSSLALSPSDTAPLAALISRAYSSSVACASRSRFSRACACSTSRHPGGSDVRPLGAW